MPGQRGARRVNGMRFVERLDQATAVARAELDADCASLVSDTCDAIAYRKYLCRTYGFVAPVERSLAETPDLENFLDLRSLRKHVLIVADLSALGMRQVDIGMVPQCMSIPWFDDPIDALGWAYVIERGTQGHTQLFRRLAIRLPGELAFAASYLKCYVGSVGEMWRGFSDRLERAGADPRASVRIIQSAQTAYVHFRRFRRTLDGLTLSGLHVLPTTDTKAG